MTETGRHKKSSRLIHNIVRGVKKFFLYSVLIFFFFIFTFPFYYVFVLATRSYDTIFNVPPPITFGTYFIHNVTILLDQLPFLSNFLNSTVIAVCATGTRIFFCTMAGFALSKYKFPGRQAIYTLVLVILMFPRFFTIIPMFKMMVWFRWVNTYLPLIIPGMTEAIGVFLMTQFMSQAIPDDLLDAARIDGLNDFQILIRVVFPLTKPGISVLGTITFIGSWNDFLYALVMLPERIMQTLPVALSSLYLMGEGDFGALMMGNALTILPLLIIFVIFSKTIINNFLAGSIKG
ncbi:MAG: carbohydrate ABC transporter permease [Spirochaetales bacterium]|nr:carbohydrate ABC transporter permease [Spirochaetales bacterium]